MAKHNAGGVNRDPSLRIKIKTKVKSADEPTKKKSSDSDAPVKKKKRVAEEDLPPRKKKKKKRDAPEPNEPNRTFVVSGGDVKIKKKKKNADPGHEIALLTRDLTTEMQKRTKLSKRHSDGGTITGDEAESIQQLLADGNTDAAIPMLHSTILRTLTDLIPYAEAQIRKTEGAKGVYQINSLISSIREIMTDIQMSQDRAALGSMIIERFLQPEFRQMATDTMEIYALLRDDIKPLVSDAAYDKITALVKESRNTHASKFNRSYTTLKDQIVEYLRN